MRIRLTRAQRAVITGRGHLLVAAGAGSGKTTTVVQAICHQLGLRIDAPDGAAAIEPVAAPLALDEIAAVTFTNAAAADLKRKLRHALRAGGRTDLAHEVDVARIGTIHGFCGDLLREHALRARLRPAHRLLPDGEARVLVADCAREAMHAAIVGEDVPGLPALLEGRRLRDVTDWVTRAVSDAGRLERWAAARPALRLHEQALLDLALRADARRRARLDAEGLTDFDHLLMSARALLRDDAVRRAAQRRIRLLVVDEFQDVDPVQRDIAELLGGLATDDPAPTRLVLVGDPKQSIYRFRRADVTLWNELEARFRAGAGTVLPLSENFRSRAPILGFVDHVIGQLLDAPVDEACGRQRFEVDYAPLTPMVESDASEPALELQVVPAGDDGKVRKAADVRLADATATARRIRELTADGRFSHGDVAVLLASWSDVALYEDALRAAGIPVYVRRAEGFWDAREVIDCVLALRAIRDAADAVAMAGFLKGPMVGATDATLLALARLRGGGTYRDALDAALAAADAVPPAPGGREALERARDLLDRFGTLRDRLPLAELVRRLVMESGFIAECALEHDGAQRVANLRKLVRLAGASANTSLGAFLRAVHEARERAEKIAPEPLYRERGDVVTITSIHAAKGLEWPVVFWCDLVREVYVEKAPFCEGRDRFSIASGSADAEDAGDGGDPPGADAPGDPHVALQGATRQEAIAEAYRLWYVASTRAKQLLVLGGIPLGESKRTVSPARLFLAALAELGEPGDGSELRHERFAARVHVGRDAPAPAVARAEAEVPPDVRPSAIRVAAGSARLSATQLMTFDRDAAGWRRDYVLRVPRTGKAGDAERALLIGQVTHDVLEHVEDGTLDPMPLIEEALARWDEDAPGAESEAGVRLRALLRERVDAATSSRAWREVAGSPGARRELWFTRLLPDGSSITGAFDLAAPAPDQAGAPRARILDVKASGTAGVVAAARYAVQAATYVDAVRAIAGTDASFALLSLPSAEVTPVEPAPEALPALVARLRGA